MAYSHAYSLGFEVISECGDASDVTSAMLQSAVLKRIALLAENDAGDDMLAACDAPWDTMETDP